MTDHDPRTLRDLLAILAAEIPTGVLLRGTDADGWCIQHRSGPGLEALAAIATRAAALRDALPADPAQA